MNWLLLSIPVLLTILLLRERRNGAVWASLVAVLATFGVTVFGSGAPEFPRHVTQVEFVEFEQSIQSFRQLFGSTPPSFIQLYEQPTDWTHDPRSRSLIVRLWPQFDFATRRDLNSDGDFNDSFELTGAECLVFFLGGFDERGDSRTLTGFSKNPRDPFSRGTGDLRESRDGPCFEFQSARLVDIDEDGFCEFLPPWKKVRVPYIYASSYDGAGYRNDDLRLYPPEDARNLETIYTSDQAGQTPLNPNSFQIICAGGDNACGVGGYYDPELADVLLSGDRAVERDNLTNFQPGLLQAQ